MDYGIYKKKPVERKAVQLTLINIERAMNFTKVLGPDRELVSTTPPIIEIRTMNGDLTVNTGDYIIQEEDGSFYPCKPDTFKKLYDLVEYVTLTEEERDEQKRDVS